MHAPQCGVIHAFNIEMKTELIKPQTVKSLFTRKLPAGFLVLFSSIFVLCYYVLLLIFA